MISQLWLTSHPRSTVVLLNTVTPGISREIYNEDADDGTQTRNPSVIMIRVCDFWALKISSKYDELLQIYCFAFAV